MNVILTSGRRELGYNFIDSSIFQMVKMNTTSEIYRMMGENRALTTAELDAQFTIEITSITGIIL
jgi:hypothetical protein